MPTLLLLRHGVVDNEGSFYGQLDLPLSPKGREQAEAAAQALRHYQIGSVLSSDLARARQTAEIVATPHGLEVAEDPAFREMNLGALEGVPVKELAQRFPEHQGIRYRQMWRHRFPGGENLQDVADRMRPALERALKHSADPLLLVAHNSVNRIIIGDALGLPLQQIFDFVQDFACINILHYGSEQPNLKLLNWTPSALD